MVFMHIFDSNDVNALNYIPCVHITDIDLLFVEHIVIY